MFGLFRKKPESYFTQQDQDAIVEAIRKAEQRTSGEIRIYIEGKCRMVNPVHRAQEIFHQQNMQHTDQRNAVLLYVAMKDRQLAVYGDEGIHAKVGTEFWTAQVKKMLQQFAQQNYVTGFVQIIHEIGEALVQHFPYDKATDKNELPDDILFGK